MPSDNNVLQLQCTQSQMNTLTLSRDFYILLHFSIDFIHIEMTANVFMTIKF